MPQSSRLPLDRAVVMIAAAMAKGEALGLKPITVAILDAGQHLIALQRQDGSSNLRPQIAIGKAAGALALGVSSRQIGAMAVDRPTFVAALGPIAAQGVIPAAGGLLIGDADGALIGAIGVTGDTSDNDELCAQAGIEAAGFTVLG
jgi:uncharacterized protein GlcG (DUF336 family)